MDNFIYNVRNIFIFIKYNKLVSLLIFIISLIILIYLISFFGYITMVSQNKFFEIVYTLGYNKNLTNKFRSLNYYLEYNQVLSIEFKHKNGHNFHFVTPMTQVFDLVENTIVQTLNDYPHAFDRDKYIIKTETSEYMTYHGKQIIKADLNNVKFKEFLKDLELEENKNRRVLFDDKFLKNAVLHFVKREDLLSYQQHIDQTKVMSNLINFLNNKEISRGSLIYYALLNDKKSFCLFIINYYIGVR